MYSISQFNNECFENQLPCLFLKKLLANVIVFLLALQLWKTLNSQFTFSNPFSILQSFKISPSKVLFLQAEVLNYSVSAQIVLVMLFFFWHGWPELHSAASILKQGCFVFSLRFLFFNLFYHFLCFSDHHLYVSEKSPLIRSSVCLPGKYATFFSINVAACLLLTV